MKTFLRAAVSLMISAFAAMACAPLTFSEPAALDFATYRAVRVVVVPSFTDPATATQYLAEQLTLDSGFERVTTNAAERVDLVLSVQVAVTSETDSDGEIEYASEAEYVATTPSGELVKRGEEDDRSQSPAEAVEDVLDEIALRFIRPYRL